MRIWAQDGGDQGPTSQTFIQRVYDEVLDVLASMHDVGIGTSALTGLSDWDRFPGGPAILKRFEEAKGTIEGVLGDLEQLGARE